MTESSDRNKHEDLERYLNRLLTEEQRAVFERSMEIHPEVRRQHELQQCINESLRRTFRGAKVSAEFLDSLHAFEAAPPLVQPPHR